VSVDQLDHMQNSFAPYSRQITMSVLYHSVYTGWMHFSLPNQQRQSTVKRSLSQRKCRKVGWLLRNTNETVVVEVQLLMLWRFHNWWSIFEEKSPIWFCFMTDVRVGAYSTRDVSEFESKSECCRNLTIFGISKIRCASKQIHVECLYHIKCRSGPR